jgi:hypothetical protein
VTGWAPTWRRGVVRVLSGAVQVRCGFVRVLTADEGFARTTLRRGFCTGVALRSAFGFAFALTWTTGRSRGSSIPGTSVFAGERQSASAAAKGIATAAARIKSRYLNKVDLAARREPGDERQVKVLS